MGAMRKRDGCLVCASRSLVGFGSGVNEPMTVKEVNVWQASDAENLHF